jgi:hypothetical protein
MGYPNAKSASEIGRVNEHLLESLFLGLAQRISFRIKRAFLDLKYCICQDFNYSKGV